MLKSILKVNILKISLKYSKNIKIITKHFKIKKLF